jgi:hypothetical protein
VIDVSTFGKVLLGIFAVAGIVAALPAWAEPAAEEKCKLSRYTGDKVALVIGTDDYSPYQTEKIPNLKNASNDARKIADLLSRQGFAVRCLLNPTQFTFRDETNRLSAYLLQRQLDDPTGADGGRVVIYIAGHGYRDPDNSQDYLLLRFEQDEAKYSNVVDLTTPGGRIAQGRQSVQALMQKYNAIIQGVLFIFDACRSPVEVPTAAGVSVRAGQIPKVAQQFMRGLQVAAYSTQPGGVAADTVPGSAEQNGLYMSVLSSFIGLPISTLGRALDLTGLIVKISNDDQRPAYSVSAGTLFLGNPWLNDPLHETCDLVDAAIWNAAGRHCSSLRDKPCIKKDLCPVVRPQLKGGPEAVACIARHKEKWLRVDLVGICSETEAASGPPTTDRAPASTPAGPIVSIVGSRSDAYNVVTVDSNPQYATDFAAVTLSGWAAKVASAAPATNNAGAAPVQLDQGSLEKALAGFRKSTTKLVYASAQRDNLIVKSADGPPPLSSASPFSLDMAGRKIKLNNLPAANAGSIRTFDGDTALAEIDCETIACSDNWIGVRVTEKNTIFRGWASTDALKSLVSTASAVNLKYDGSRIAPRLADLEKLRRALALTSVGPPQPSGRVHIIATRTRSDAQSSLLAAARLSYLSGIIVDVGLDPDAVKQTVLDAPDASTLPQVIVSVGSSRSKPETAPSLQGSSDRQ